MRVLLKDVAKAAGVSPGVISRVLNDRPSTVRVSDDTRERVIRMAKRMGYRPNPIAQSLKTKRTATIGVVVNAPDRLPMLQAAEHHATSHGFDLLLGISEWDREREANEIERLLNRNVDGLLIISPSIREGRQEILERLVRDHFPLVGVGPVITEGMDFVDWDRTTAFRQLTEHLLSRGCRRFAFLVDCEPPGILARREGIEEALRTVDGAELSTFMHPACGQREALDRNMGPFQTFLKEWKGDAAMCVPDEVAMMVIRAAQSLGIDVPRDLAVSGSTNNPWSAIADVPLTTVSMPGEAMLKVAIDHLVQRVSGKRRDGRFVRYVAGKPVIRRSSLFGQPRALS